MDDRRESEPRSRPTIEVEPLSQRVVVVTLRAVHDVSTKLELAVALERACGSPRISTTGRGKSVRTGR
jgi:hypothetical protein